MALSPLDIELRQALIVDLHAEVERLEFHEPSDFAIKKKELLLQLLGQYRRSMGVDESSEMEDAEKQELRKLRDQVRDKERRLAQYRQIISICQAELAGELGELSGPPEAR